MGSILFGIHKINVCVFRFEIFDDEFHKLQIGEILIAIDFGALIRQLLKHLVVSNFVDAQFCSKVFWRDSRASWTASSALGEQWLS